MVRFSLSGAEQESIGQPAQPLRKRDARLSGIQSSLRRSISVGLERAWTTNKDWLRSETGSSRTWGIFFWQLLLLCKRSLLASPGDTFLDHKLPQSRRSTSERIEVIANLDSSAILQLITPPGRPIIDKCFSIISHRILLLSQLATAA